MKSKVYVQRDNGIKRVFGILDMEHHLIDKTMYACGYYLLRDGNYVRDVINKKRFHAVVTKEGIELHVDRTSDTGRHYVADWESMVAIERKKIKRQHLIFNPKQKKPKVERKHWDEVVPNLMEIQRTFKTPPPKRGIL